MTDPRPDDALGAWLRAGDPARDGAEPAAEDLAALRRRVLTRVPDRPRVGHWLPASAAIAVAAAIVLVLLPERLDEVAAPRPASLAGASIDPDPVAPAPRGPTPGASRSPRPETPGAGTPSGTPAPEPVLATSVAAAPIAASAASPAGDPAPPTVAAAHRRQVQFTTANGTRVIWVLDADLAL